MEKAPGAGYAAQSVPSSFWARAGLLASFVGPPTAWAEGQAPAGVLPLELSWDAPPECPDAARVRAQVARLVRGPSNVPRPQLRAHGRVSRADDGVWLLSLRISTEGASGDRELRGDSCESLAGSASVVLALRLEPTADGGAVTAPQPQPQPALPLPPPRALDVPLRTRAHEGRVRPRIGFGISGDTAALPEPTAGGQVRAGLGVGRWAFGLAGQYWLPRERVFTGSGRARGTFTWQAASAQACNFLLGTEIRVGPCLSVEAGALAAASTGVRAPGRSPALWLAASAGVGVAAFPVDSLELTLELAALVPLFRPRFVVEGAGMVHQPAAAGARAFVGSAFRF